MQDQRMVSAFEKWSACMQDRGYRYADPDAIDTDLLDRFQSVMGVGVRPGATATPTPGTSYDRRALTALQREEVKIATGDLECEQREVTPVEEVVRPQHERTFRKENRALLERVPPAG